MKISHSSFNTGKWSYHKCQVWLTLALSLTEYWHQLCCGAFPNSCRGVWKSRKVERKRDSKHFRISESNFSILWLLTLTYFHLSARQLSQVNLLPSLKSATAVTYMVLLNHWIKQNYLHRLGSQLNVTVSVWKEYKQKLPFGPGIHRCKEAEGSVTIHLPLFVSVLRHIPHFLSCISPHRLSQWSPSSFSRHRMWRKVCGSAR